MPAIIDHFVRRVMYPIISADLKRDVCALLSNLFCSGSGPLPHSPQPYECSLWPRNTNFFLVGCLSNKVKYLIFFPECLVFWEGKLLFGRYPEYLDVNGQIAMLDSL